MGDTVQCPTCNGSGVIPDRKAQGARMMKIRTDARVTLREVAALLNLSVGYISDMEHGRKGWTPKRVNFYLAAVETVRQERPPRDGASPKGAREK